MRKTIVNRYGNKQGGIKELNDNYRVVQVHRDRYLVRNEEKELYCTLTGNLRYREVSMMMWRLLKTLMATA